jgi:type IV secretory pathway protease TraF
MELAMSKATLYMLLALAGGALVLLIHFTLNTSVSEPIGLYRITAEPLHRGALVLLRDPLKRLVGMPGDEIRMAPEGVYVNGHLIPDSAVPTGAPYPHYPYGTYKLAPDQYWAMGQHPLSFDGRYIGPLPSSVVASTVEPFITW